MCLPIWRDLNYRSNVTATHSFQCQVMAWHSRPLCASSAHLRRRTTTPARTWSGMISFASTEGMPLKLAILCAVAGVRPWEPRQTETMGTKRSCGSIRRSAHGDRSPWTLGIFFGPMDIFADVFWANVFQSELKLIDMVCKLSVSICKRCQLFGRVFAAYRCLCLYQLRVTEVIHSPWTWTQKSENRAQLMIHFHGY